MDAGRSPPAFTFRGTERRQESPRGDKGKLALTALIAFARQPSHSNRSLRSSSLSREFSAVLRSNSFWPPLPSTFFCNECRYLAISRSLTPGRYPYGRYPTPFRQQPAIFIDKFNRHADCPPLRNIIREGAAQ